MDFLYNFYNNGEGHSFGLFVMVKQSSLVHGRKQAMCGNCHL
ncbi:hypothetical protein HHE014_07550 [Helicobacter heilmannii]|nr:hypothetical protein HHE014_07550 [Helicobacter heilmannii]